MIFNICALHLLSQVSSRTPAWGRRFGTVNCLQRCECLHLHQNKLLEISISHASFASDALNERQFDMIYSSEWDIQLWRAGGNRQKWNPLVSAYEGKYCARYNNAQNWLVLTKENIVLVIIMHKYRFLIRCPLTSCWTLFYRYVAF